MLGEAVRPLSPCHLAARRDPAGRLLLSWLGRARGGWAWLDAVETAADADFQGYRVTVSGGGNAIDRSVGETSIQIEAADLAGLGPLRADLIGVSSIFADDGGRWLADLPAGDGRDVRLRVALRHDERTGAERLTREVMALYTCGPAGGGGVRTSLKPTLGTLSCLLPREQVRARFDLLDGTPTP